MEGPGNCWHFHADLALVLMPSVGLSLFPLPVASLWMMLRHRLMFDDRSLLLMPVSMADFELILLKS
jgi:hypothetical protein